MEVAHIFDEKEKGKIYGLMGNINLTTNNMNYNIVTDYKFKGKVKEYLNSEKALSSLKMVMLKEEILNKTFSELSIGDLKKISFAKALIENKDYIVLNYFDKELNDQERKNIKRLLKRLADDYHKTIIIFTNDIPFFWDIAECLIIVDKYNIINTISKKDYFKFMDDINKPEIVKFVELVRELGINIEDYQDSSDLLKAIYRLKEQKE